MWLAKLAAHARADARGRVSRSSLSDWKNGKALPDTEEQLLAVLHVLLPKLTIRVRQGQLDPATLTDGLREEAAWVRWYAAARAAPPGFDSFASNATPWSDTTVAEADPLRLGVHRAPQLIQGSSVSRSEGGSLPVYLERPHDAELRAVLEQALITMAAGACWSC